MPSSTRNKIIAVVATVTIIVIAVATVIALINRGDNNTTPNNSTDVSAEPTLTASPEAGLELEYEKVCANGGDGSHGEPCEWRIKQQNTDDDFHPVSPTDNSTPHYGSPDKEAQQASRKAFQVAKSGYKCVLRVKTVMNRDEIAECAKQYDAGGFTEFAYNYWTDRDVQQSIDRGEKVEVAFEEWWEIDTTKPYTDSDMWVIIHPQLRVTTKYMSKDEIDNERIANKSDPYRNAIWETVHCKKKADGSWGVIDWETAKTADRLNDWPNTYDRY